MTVSYSFYTAGNKILPLFFPLQCLAWFNLKNWLPKGTFVQEKGNPVGERKLIIEKTANKLRFNLVVLETLKKLSPHLFPSLTLTTSSPRPWSEKKRGETREKCKSFFFFLCLDQVQGHKKDYITNPVNITW